MAKLALINRQYKREKLVAKYAKKREALIHQIQQILSERVTHVPIYELAFIWGVGPRVEEPGVNLIRSYAYSAPVEDLKLKRP